MRERYRAIMEDILLHYGKLTELAANLAWQNTEHTCIETALDAKRNLHLNVYAVAFPPGYVQTHFAEAFTQMLLTVIAMQEEWNPAGRWGSMSADKRRECLNDDLRREHLLFSGRLSDLEPEQFADSVLTCAVGCPRQWVESRLEPAVICLLDRFAGGWHLAVGALSQCTPCEYNWLAMQGDEFLFVTYYEGWN